jgi:Family of unknown function (DUF6088)
VTKINDMISVQMMIWNTLQQGEKNKVIFPIDFVGLGSDEAVRQGLARLVKAGFLVRLAQGIYFYPDKDPEWGIIYPPIEMIAEAIALRDHARIIPTGVQALNRLGLSTQLPLKALYMTDGSPRTLKIGNRTIEFQKKSAKTLSIQNKLLIMLISALQTLGKDHITPEIIFKLKQILLNNSSNDLSKELGKAPAWIRKLIENLQN